MNYAMGLMALLCVTQLAAAQHAGDILLSVAGGRIRTAMEIGEGLAEPARVFPSEMGEVAPGFTDEPGFDSTIGTFAFSSSIGFRVQGPLLRWTEGTGDGRSPREINIAFGPLGPVASPPCNTMTEGFALSVGSNGTWHRHLEFTIDENAASGVYILGLTLFSSDPETSESEPFWIVFNHGAAEAEHDAAIEWTTISLAAAACPADFDASGDVGVPDIFAFLTAWFAGNDAPGAWRADVDHSCDVGVPDIFAFLSSWFAGCGD